MVLVATDLNIILRCCSCMGIVPFYNGKNRHFESNKIYTFIVIAFILGTYAHIAVSDSQSDRNDKTSVFVFETLTTVASTFINVYTIYKAAYSNLPNIQKLFDTFNSIDSALLSIHHTNVSGERFALIVFGLVNCYMIAYLSCFIYISFWVDLQPWYFVRYGIIIQLYYIVITATFQYYILQAVQRRFVLINNAIENLELPAVNILEISKTSEPEMSYKVENLIKLHNKACDLVDLFNDIFGWYVLFTVFYTFLKVLSAIDFGLSDSEKTNLVDFIYTGVGVAYLVAQEVALSVKCEYISREGKESVAKAYKTLIRYMNIQNLKSKLFVLAQQTTTRYPSISAAGFFDVNFAMLFMLVNLLTTYVIVIIQFLPTNNGQQGTPAPTT